MKEVVRLATTIVGVEVETLLDPRRARASDVPELVADVGRLSDATGWRPSYALEDTLRDMFAAPDDAVDT